MIKYRLTVNILNELKEIISKTNSDYIIVIISFFEYISKAFCVSNEVFINKNDDSLARFLVNFELYNYKPDYLDIIIYDPNIESVG